METPDGEPCDPAAAVRHVLAVLDAFDANQTGPALSTNTLSFLMLLRQQEVLGDLLYASPEQARGETVDERSLVFSVGVLLFERLTGRHPFGVEGNPKRMARIRKGEMGSGVNFFPAVPSGLRMILLKAMGPFPEERWTSLAELREKLEEFVADASGDNRPAPKKLIPLKPLVVEPKLARQADEEPTRVHQRPADAGLRPQASGLSQNKKRSLAPVLYIALGAALASIGFTINGNLVVDARSQDPASAPAAATPAPAPAPAATAAPAPAPALAPEPAPEAKPEPAPEPPAPAVAPSGTFDAETAGQHALAAARPCFTDAQLERGISFGVGLRFSPDGLSTKTYLPADELPPFEKACLSKALVGLSGGGPLGKNDVIEYRMKLTTNGGELKVRAKKPKAPAAPTL